MTLYTGVNVTSKTITASAEVTITLKLHDLGAWGEECTVNQILRQATEAAKSRAHKMLSPGTQCNLKIGNVTMQEQ